MTDLDTSALRSLAARKPKPSKPGWEPFELSELRPYAYLAADPSMDAFGLVLLEVTQYRVSVELAETFRIKGLEGATGWEDLLQRTGALERALEHWIMKWVLGHYRKVLVVHEMPPMGGGRLVNREVPLLASYAFRNACGPLPRLKMVPRRQHALLICGDGNADKKDYHRVLKERYLPQIEGSELITNEATRDATCVALYAAWARNR